MNKSKILKIIVIIIVLIVCIFLIDLGRKVYILSKYSDMYNKYSNVTNFYRKESQEEGVTIEFWRKDNLGLLKSESKDNLKMIYYGTDYNWIFVNDKDSKTAVKMVKEGIGIEEQHLITSTLYIENFWDTIKIAFFSNISSEKLDNIECYKIIINNDWQIFINKDSFLVMREINGSTDTGIIEYKIEEVKDEDIVMPDLSEYTINDYTTQK